jgi:hypothetical protein
VSREPFGRKLDTPHGVIEVMPWEIFMQNLWQDKLF